MFEPVNIEDLNLKTTKSDTRLLSYLSNTIENSHFVIAGYPDDEGIKNNGGRPGARLAPNLIREFLFKMTPPAFNPTTSLINIYDMGNLKLDQELGLRHESAITDLTQVLLQNKSLISFGGGHDYGYVDGQSFLNFCHKTKLSPLVINFDAHLDVRPMDKGITSGTPFFRLLSEQKFDFFEIGLQEQCNSKAHLKWLTENGGKYLSLNELYSQNTEQSAFINFEKFENLFSKIKNPKRPCYVSVDIDAFSNAFAPGCSQSFATGLEPHGFFKMFNYLLQNFEVKVLGLYEVSPPLDFDNHTSKLASLIAYKYIHHSKKGG